MTDVMVPCAADPILPFGSPKFARFSALKNSERNCRPIFSVSAKSLSAPRSQVPSPGPIRMLRPAFPNVYKAGATKQLVLKNALMVCWELGRFPSQTRLGLVNVPVFAVGVESETENGAPLCMVTMLEICHPPAMAFVRA